METVYFIKSSKMLFTNLDHLQKPAVNICLRLGQDIPEDMLLHSTKEAKLGKRCDAHLLNYMYKKKDCIELLHIKKSQY